MATAAPVNSSGFDYSKLAGPRCQRRGTRRARRGGTVCSVSPPGALLLPSVGGPSVAPPPTPCLKSVMPFGRVLGDAASRWHKSVVITRGGNSLQGQTQGRRHGRRPGVPQVYCRPVLCWCRRFFFFFFVRCAPEGVQSGWRNLRTTASHIFDFYPNDGRGVVIVSTSCIHTGCRQDCCFFARCRFAYFSARTSLLCKPCRLFSPIYILFLHSFPRTREKRQYIKHVESPPPLSFFFPFWQT